MEDRRPRPVFRFAAVTAVLAALGLLLAPVPTSWLGVWHGQLFDFGHVPLFAVLLWTLRAGLRPPLRRPLFAAVALAGLVEVVQPFVGRTGDWADFLRGSLGALAAAAAVRAWESRGSPLRFVAYLTLAVALPVGPVVEVAPYVADTVEGRRAFPVLATFSTDQEVLRWEGNQATLSRTAESGCRVEFLVGPAEYPGIALRPVVCDFRSARWLCCEFQFAGAPLELVTSLRTGTSDPKRTAHTDIGRRYGVGTHTVRLGLAAMTARGDPEPLDLSDVRQVIFFVVRPTESRTILLTRVWLEP